MWAPARSFLAVSEVLLEPVRYLEAGWVVVIEQE